MSKYSQGIISNQIADTLINAAGKRGVTIIKSNTSPPGNNPYQGKPVTIESDTVLRQSVLGTPILTDLTLTKFSYYDTYKQQQVTGDDNIRLDTVLITVTQPIKVIKTEIQGAPIGTGSIKEYIGMADAEIVINGIITGQNLNGVYPKQEVNQLKQWLDAPVTKGVVSWWLQNLGINYIVVDSYSFAQAEGNYSQQIFTIKASSDAPVNLKNVSLPVQSAT